MNDSGKALFFPIGRFIRKEFWKKVCYFYDALSPNIFDYDRFFIKGNPQTHHAH